ncbi:MAG: FCD domain-containing protein, partial [Pseudomonadota bacterium]
GNLLTASRYDAEFHMAIVEATGNVVTVQVMRSLEVLLQSGIRQSHKIGYENPESLEQLVVQHQRILSAIRSGNSKKASAAMSDHLEAQAHNFEQQLKAAVRRKVTEQRRDWSKSKRD